MPRLRNPSLKIRENMEGFTAPTTPSCRGGRTTASSRSATPPTKTTVTKTPGTVRGGTVKRKGRPPKAKSAKKSIGRPRKTKSKYDDELNQYGYEYESHSSSSSSDDDDEEFLISKPEPLDFLSDEDIDDQNGVKQESLQDENNEIFCPWIEQENVPTLILPESSSDIPMLKDYIMDLVEMYEILRSFSRTLKLTPFIFEDFCAAMSSPDNSRILSEVHITLLKACLRADDEEQVHYSANDTNNAVNITFYSLDSMTYAEVLRLYLESDRTKGRVPEEILSAINTPNYPFVSIDIRASVITYLCYRFLDQGDFKRIVLNHGRFVAEDTCRICAKQSGDLIQCNTCDLSFHTYCLRTKEVDDTFKCELCEKNNIKGVIGCEPLDQVSDRQPLRMTPIGRDRHGRIYWFVVRRLIIQDEAENILVYYSTAPQLYELVSVLDPNYYEYDLCVALCERLGDILEQMAVTTELTIERCHTINAELVTKNKAMPEQSRIHIDNVLRMKKILQKISKSSKKISKKEEDDSYQPLPERLEPLLGIDESGRLINNFWAGQYSEEAVLSFDENTVKERDLFTLGHQKYDDQYRKYRNYYIIHDCSENFAAKKKSTDRKKYMATRFCLLDEGEDAFRWSTAKGKDMYGPERQHAKYLEWTIAKLSKKIPVEMMHRRWPEIMDEWKDDLSKAETYESLSDCLLRFEACMRRTLFLSQFWSSLGLTRWTRTTVDDREQASKENQRKKKDEKDATSPDFDDPDYIRVKYSRLPNKACPQTLWRQRDETYRLGGKIVLGGWIWISSSYKKKWTAIPEKPSLSCLKSTSKEKQIPYVKSAQNLESIIQRLTNWRTTEEKLIARSRKHVCYSPTCRRDLTKRPKLCYSFYCRSETLEVSNTELSCTKSIAKAKDITKLCCKKERPGEGNNMWPILHPTPFISRSTKKKSILVVPDLILRRLAKTGGRTHMYVPNFSLSAKSNFALWNYPCYRPCFDLCWKWLTTNATSLHAVSLQLKILWYCIKWIEFLPGDNETEDGRLIVHQPDRDDVRMVVGHKEFPPQGTYERYLLSVENRIKSVMLDDDDEDEDYDRNSSTRKKNNKPRQRRMISKNRKNIRQEWIDGVELKVFEIRSYWEKISSRNDQASNLIWTKDYITAKDLYKTTNRILLNGYPSQSRPYVSSGMSSYSSPNCSTFSALNRTRRVIPPRRDNNFVYDDQELDNIEQASYSSEEPAPKRARVLLQPGVTVGYMNKYPVDAEVVERQNVRYINGDSYTNIPRNEDRRQNEMTPESRRFQISGTPSNESSNRIARAAAGTERRVALTPSYQAHSSVIPSTASSSTSSTPRQVLYTQRSSNSQNGKVILIRRNDGSTQYLRPVPVSAKIETNNAGNATNFNMSGPPVRRVVSVNALQPGTVVRTVTVPTRIIRTGPNGERIVQILQPGSRIITRLPQTDGHPGSSLGQPVMRSVQYRTNSQVEHRPVNVSRVPNRAQDRYAKSYSENDNTNDSFTSIQSDERHSSSAEQSSFSAQSASDGMDFDEDFLEPPSMETNNNPS